MSGDVVVNDKVGVLAMGEGSGRCASALEKDMTFTIYLSTKIQLGSFSRSVAENSLWEGQGGRGCTLFPRLPNLSAALTTRTSCRHCYGARTHCVSRVCFSITPPSCFINSNMSHCTDAARVMDHRALGRQPGIVFSI
ncbi:1-phosphatidylinositol 4,5-bisphosphate phosphodiesterase epsilon-1 [Branchiostoma belcheri]|nr:1-phosphatidylinositol 4,5-bisphosphate phosphodiesterase epsilon-1 [Branchiostoma belcheri]